MIGKLRGLIDSIFEDYTIIDVHGVGYRVFCSSKTLSFLQSQQGEVSLTIETNVKEDHIHLFGFLNQQEKDIFIKLCTVNGVGSKMCIKIMSVLTIEEINYAIISGDKKAFCRASGVGPKLAQRIITELKGSISKTGISLSTPTTSGQTTQTSTTSASQNLINDAISALENLGYDRSSTYKICVEKYNKNCNITLESLITESLRDLSLFNNKR
jgi:Holliday junction DNA helicase RuvA